MMTESEKHEGYGWIKVKRAKAQLAGDVDPTTKVVSEEHHIEETSFLIERIRELAKKVDSQSVALQVYYKKEEQRRDYDSRQARWDSDYLGYQDDEYDRG